MPPSPNLPLEKFGRITGERWDYDIDFRRGIYDRMFVQSLVEPKKIVKFAVDMVTLFEQETDTRSYISRTLSRRLLRYQKGFGTPDFSPFYEKIIGFVKDREPSHFTFLLMDVGLAVAARELKPSSQEFFSFAVDYVAAHAGKNTRTFKARHISRMIKGIGIIGNARPEAITPRYIEACCAVLAVPYGATPNEEGREMRLLKAGQFIATDTMMRVIKRFETPVLLYAPEELFTDESREKLRIVSSVSPDLEVRLFARKIRNTVNLWELDHPGAVKGATYRAQPTAAGPEFR